MKRIQRRVRDSDMPHTSRSLTFDRKTFLECSKRMKGLVSTLGRQQSFKDDEDEAQSIDDNNYNELMCSKAEATSVRVDDVKVTIDNNCEVEMGQREDNAEANRDSQSNVVVFGNLSLPGPSTVNLTIRSASMSDNHPSVIATTKKRKRSRSRDSIWMKPLSHFVSFMSIIGGNVDITSYPPS
ncbi:hypothetical protein Ocin01_09404 [Orchesella cincta]|uniref:Uncharacterized protein n=1 Tax=Orchesella cincta TaxID=48709 RepID=A0A1D2MWG7_ORCCI|nr:hypothetical protein Ocin01_09404 [Orchesella cincta]